MAKTKRTESNTMETRTLIELREWFFRDVCCSLKSQVPHHVQLYNTVEDEVYNVRYLHPFDSLEDVWCKLTTAPPQSTWPASSVHYVTMNYTGSTVRVPLAVLATHFQELFQDEYIRCVTPVGPKTPIIPWASYIFRALQYVVNRYTPLLQECNPKTEQELLTSAWEYVFHKFAGRTISGSNHLLPNATRKGLVVVPRDPMGTTMSQEMYDQLRLAQVSEVDESEAEAEAEAEDDDEASGEEDDDAEESSDGKGEALAKTIVTLTSVVHKEYELIRDLHREVAANEESARAMDLVLWQSLAPPGVKVTLKVTGKEKVACHADVSEAAESAPQAKRHRGD